MASEDKPDDVTADDGMADWAEALLEQKGSDTSTGEPPGGVLAGDSPRPFSQGGTQASDAAGNDINMVLDIPVQLSVELGRTKVPIKHILQLGQGSVVELDALAGEPMDVLVNGYLIAQGEVVVVNDKFGIRLTDVVTPSERLRRVSKS
jgi:flagellar motor switch protein FliN/FliY